VEAAGGCDLSASTCFVAEGNPVGGCQCHPTCHTCGYSTNPTGEGNCLTCAEGLVLVPGRDGVTGKCEAPGLCYSSPHGDALHGCQCHATCHACGYNNNPTLVSDCISCPPGRSLHNGKCELPKACYGDVPPWQGGKDKGCICYHTCQTCGFPSKSQNGVPDGIDNCLSCPDEKFLSKLSLKGNGYCADTPCQLFCIQSVSASEVATGASGLAVLVVVGAMVVRTQRQRYRADNVEVLKPIISSKEESRFQGYGAVSAGDETRALLESPRALEVDDELLSEDDCS